LRPYLEEKPKKDRRELELLEAAKEKFKKARELKESKSPDVITTAIGNAVSQELGVKVSVSGRVEIVFKWE
jgi:hypothetical protein